MLGSGAYGLVFKGKLKRLENVGVRNLDRCCPVAIKTIREGADVEFVRSLLDEIKTMAYVGEHDFIVKFVGASVENIMQSTCC